MRVSYLIDGFNLYGSIVDLQNQRKLNVKWLNIASLLSSYIHLFGKTASVSEIHYFTALQEYAKSYDPDKVNRHKAFIKCLEDTGITVHYGRFKRKYMYCPKCKKHFEKWEEKETDVSIGVTLLDIASSNTADIVILVTGDTDLAPAVRTCMKLYPGIEIGFVFPFNRKRKELWSLATVGTVTIKEAQYVKHQFDNPYTLRSGGTVSKPGTW